MPTYGQRPDDVVQDTKGNALQGVTISFYDSESAAEAGGTSLGTTTTDNRGRWRFTPASDGELWARLPDATVWQVTPARQATKSELDAETAARNAALGLKADQSYVDTSLVSLSKVGISQPTAVTIAALQAAADAAAAAGFEFRAAGTVTTDTTLTITSDCDLAGLTINYTGAGTAVQVGSGTSGGPGILWHKKIQLPTINNASKVALGWTGATVGVRIVNAYACQITVPRIRNFVTGLFLDALGTGTVFNDIRVGNLSNNKRNLVLGAGAGGWTNSNTFLLGALSFDSAEGANVAGTRDILIDVAANPVNGNLFIGGSVEGNTPEYHADVAGPYNRFNDVRWENAGGCRVIWRAAATRNVISYGYGAESLVETHVAGSNMNQIHSTASTRLNGSSNAGVLILENSSTNTAAAEVIMASGGTGAGANPATAYTTRRSANDTRMKRDTDAADRLMFDHVNGRVYFGSGAVAPAIYLGPIGTGGIGMVGGHFYFSADNTYDLGLISSLRPRYVRAATALVTGADVTVNRPAAATAGAGAMFFDTTLGKPVWSDGTNWRDAAGTTI